MPSGVPGEIFPQAPSPTGSEQPVTAASEKRTLPNHHHHHHHSSLVHLYDAYVCPDVPPWCWVRFSLTPSPLCDNNGWRKRAETPFTFLTKMGNYFSQLENLILLALWSGFFTRRCEGIGARILVLISNRYRGVCVCVWLCVTFSNLLHKFA